MSICPLVGLFGLNLGNIELWWCGRIFLDAPRISIRGCVRPLVRWSVGPSVRHAFVKKSKMGKTGYNERMKSIWKDNFDIFTSSGAN